MEILGHHVVNRSMILRSRRLSSLTMVVTAGTLCSYSHFRNQFSSSTKNSTSNNGSDEKNWFSNLMAKRFKSIKPSLSEAIMNSILRYNEHTNDIDKEKRGIVSSFETNHFRANDPLEDRHCECYLKQDNSLLFGIFDGHSGWYCSESLRTRLPMYISLALMNKEVRDKVVSKELSEDEILEYLGLKSEDELENEEIPGFEEKQKRFRTGIESFVEQMNKDDKIGKEHLIETLKYSYLSLDKDLIVEAIPDGICNEPIWSGLSGAVAVTAYVKDNDLFVSNTGDCRAVLGKKSSNGHWVDEGLTNDHTCENASEVKRIKSQHPKEKMVVYQERLLGQLQPLRSFGDVPYKWSNELHENVLDVLYGHPSVPKSIYLTPPYLTAEPEVTHRKIDKNCGFVILATDGLWDFVSSSKAVKIIGQHLEDIRNGIPQEENGATKLIRYALGRGNNNKLANMLRIHEKLKRNYHDDITVTVIYFDEDANDLKSKL